MHESFAVFRTLVGYFFTRFFDNDVLQSDGDSLTTVVRAIAMVASPGLLIAFFLQNQYPARTAWGRIEDHYFFVLYSLLTMAGIAVFECEMLFPDKLDFLVLSPLPLRGSQMLGAKATALAGFFGLFLFAANVVGVVLLPMVSKDVFWRQVWAHTLAVGSAGLFGALTILASSGVMLCVLPPRLFRLISPILRMLVVAMLALLLLHYLQFGDTLDTMLAKPAGAAKWLPSFWFLGIYEQAQHGHSAASFAASMEQRGMLATGVVFAIVGLTYPLAWQRMRRIAVEGAGQTRGHKPGLPASCLHRVVRTSTGRAMVHFITQTLARDSRYQVYLAIYCGIGLALAITCATTISVAGAVLRPEASPIGIRAVVPLLLFWTIAGLRVAFALPLNLPACWIFRITGTDRDACISAARRWVLACALGILAALLPALFWAALNLRQVLVQAICGACLCILMVDSLLFSDRGIPFTQPRSPGKTNFPLLLTLFVGVLPVFVIVMVRVARSVERRPLWLLLWLAAVSLLHWLVKLLRGNSQPKLEDGDEVEGEFQLLGLGVE